MPGELHSVGRAKGNSAGCLYGVFLIQVLKFASPLLGILVSPLFFMDNAAFPWNNMSQKCALQDPIFE